MRTYDYSPASNWLRNVQLEHCILPMRKKRGVLVYGFLQIYCHKGVRVDNPASVTQAGMWKLAPTECVCISCLGMEATLVAV